MAIKIIIDALDDEVSSITHELDQSLITVGRSKSCHIELDHPEISRRHFIVKYEESGYVVVDQQSRHGTSVDGETIDKPFSVGSEHVITVPGFSIRLLCDGEKPRLERTTVVARKLLDDLLQGEVRPREAPSLHSRDERFHFKFVEEKTTFVLGSLASADFVVTDDVVAKKHVSFVRDIFGIRIIPMPGNEVLLNNELLSEAQILFKGALVKIGDIEFMYVDSELREQLDFTVATGVGGDAIVAEESSASRTVKAPQTIMSALDRVFVFGFVAVCIGVVIAACNL